MQTLDRVPVLDLSPEIEAEWPDLLAAVERVLKSRQFIGGPEVAALEEEAADYLGVSHAVGVNSGTDALVIGLRALGVVPGDEVITSPFTFFASPESIGNVGASPVFADIDPGTFNLDLDRVREAITPRTTAIMPVHLFGRPVDMDELSAIASEHGLKVIEDCAQSFGARFGGRQTGSLGDAGAFSFFPSKNLGAFGDAGLIVTDDADVADMARKLRAHGGKHKYHNEMLGYNSRLDALQAALLRVKLPVVDEKNEGRRRVAARYGQALSGVERIVAPEVTDGHVFHQYTIRVLGGERDRVKQVLDDEGIGSMVYYPVPCHLLPVYSHLDVHLPAAESAAAEVLSLPIWPTMPEDVQDRIADVIQRSLT
ncbi:MAG: DegT/DnrJ/EryC1/StrS family aminotransferase [Gemmatimonadota bacterium]